MDSFSVIEDYDPILDALADILPLPFSACLCSFEPLCCEDYDIPSLSYEKRIYAFR